MHILHSENVLSFRTLFLRNFLSRRGLVNSQANKRNLSTFQESSVFRGTYQNELVNLTK